MTLKIFPCVQKIFTPFVVTIMAIGLLIMPVFVSESMAREEEHSLSKKLDLSLYGFVSTSYTQNFNNPSTGINNMRSFDGDSNSFRPNNAQLVLEKGASADGSHSVLAYRQLRHAALHCAKKYISKNVFPRFSIKYIR